MKDSSLKVNVGGDARLPSFLDTSGDNVNRFPSSKLKLDEFFLNWLSSPESQKLVLSLLEDAKAGRALQAPMLPATPTGQSPLSPSSTQALFNTALTTPPLSPQKGASPPRSPVSPAKRGVIHGGLGPALKRHAADAIPRFYFGPPGASASTSDERSAMKLGD
eukprot:CAMPEP_0197585914 /NCGR_PEP_ID=MMETSP1326-20131121/8072_1 /TAXON_ID=1155430 /ORGANISM="Genus nov. species nov., Strain RCC2288" /LENGTH=162 /DNA_ID=CAMNT_0043150483 /DNA_START=125 /DNA_END=610 /DNA_ORIENTATION=-